MSEIKYVTPSGLTHYDEKIKDIIDDKVDKIYGKGLSANDLTNELKTEYDDTVAKAHEHSNIDVLKKFSEDSNGMPLYDNDKFYDGFVANDLTTTEEGYALDARQGKVLNEKVTNIEGNYAKKSIYDDTVVSMGRKADTTVGTNSFAYGLDVEASGNYSHAKGVYTTASGICSNAEGEETIASGHHSHAEGHRTTASGESSHAEGNSTNKATDYVNPNSTNDEIIAAWKTNKFSLAKGESSHVGGLNCLALGDCSHAEGNSTRAIGHNSCTWGYDTTASGENAHAEGVQTKANGYASHAEGYDTTAIGWVSHAEGLSTNKATDYVNSSSTNDEIISAWNTNKFSLAKGESSHVSGGNCLALGEYSHAEGLQTKANGYASHAEGQDTTAGADHSHAEGLQCTANGDMSHAEGGGSSSSGTYSHAEGRHTIALTNQHAQGHFNNTNTAPDNSMEGTSSGTAFVIGNGTESSRSNAFRVTGEGVVYATNAAIQSGADYAEYFEWADGNPNEEDRVGHFVTFDEDNQEKIRIASGDDYILGIVSGMPSVIGNGDECWKQRYVLDDFGRYIEETFEYEVVVGFDEEGNEIKETKNGTKWKENPEYDQTKAYIPRDERAEWNAIGMVGVLSVYDDGTCQVNGYCKCTDGGIATACEKDGGYRVIKRVTDNIVKVVLK